MKTFKVFFSVVAILLALSSEGQSINPKFQAVFINGVSRNIVWSSQESNFKIAVIGSNKLLAQELKKLASTRKINNKTVQVVELPASTSSFNHDIVFVSEKDKRYVGGLLNKISPNTVLMTAFNNALSEGSHLNFFMNGNKISFELNKTALSKTNIKIKDELTKLASSVK